VSALPSNGYLFNGFSGALTGTTTPQNVTITGPVSVTASFKGPASNPGNPTPPTGDSGNGLDPRRIGVRTFGSYWGAAGEQIDTTSGNVNVSVPLLNLKSRTGWSVPVILSYNSQNWRKDSGGTWQTGADIGYGFGWRLQIGSITPVWSGLSAVDHYIFTDGTGAEYSLSVNNGGIWTSQEGTYASFDSATNILHFPDGSFWMFGCTSSGQEPDSGTMYPTQLEDSNGNSITVIYAPGAGSGSTNTSGRLGAIIDVRAEPERLRRMAWPHMVFPIPPKVFRT